METSIRAILNYNALSAHEKAGTFLAKTETTGGLTYKANYGEM